jgi:hypothetical protein
MDHVDPRRIEIEVAGVERPLHLREADESVDRCERPAHQLAHPAVGQLGEVERIGEAPRMAELFKSNYVRQFVDDYYADDNKFLGRAH